MKSAKRTATDLSATVFERIISRYRTRAGDIARFAATRYSFEEWMNWEAFAACAERRGWEAHARPRYSALGVAKCRDFGDLLVTDGAERVLVEVGLVHDGTGDKWLAKLEWDAQKLARLCDGVRRLHLIALTSNSDIDSSEPWQRWLRKVGCWNRPTSLTAAIPLPPAGTMIVRGWR